MSKKMSGFSLNTFAAPTGDWYKNVGYEDAKSIIREKMISSAENYVAIGYYLKHIWEKQQYREAGYSSIWECAKTEFGYSQGRASRYIDICEKYSVDGDSPYLDERFKAFNKSQLQELLSIKDEKLIEQVSPDMSVKEIRAMKNAAASEKDDLLPGQMTIEGEFRELAVNNDNNSPKEQEPTDREQLNMKNEKKKDIIEAAVFEKSEVIESDSEDDKVEIKMLPCNDENVECAVEFIFNECYSNTFPRDKMDELVEAFRQGKSGNCGYTSQQLIFDKLLPFENDVVKVTYQCGYFIEYIHTNETVRIPIYSFWKGFEKVFGWMWADDGNKEDTVPEPKEPDFDNLYTEAEITKGLGDTEGNDTVVIKFSGCYGEFYGTELTEREIKIFKTGVLSERERVWDRLADILDEETLQKIGYGELNRERA